MSAFIQVLMHNPAYYLTWVMLVAFSICLHEYAHAWTAHRLGDDTAADAGHLTLNPLVQMGPISLVMLLIIGIAWGQVPVSPNRLRGRYGPAWVSLAGPAANLFLCILFGLLVRVSAGWAPDAVRQVFLIGSIVNGTLMLLNLLPVPPLDGWGALSDFVPALGRLSPDIIRNLSWMLLLLILLTPAFSFVWAGGQILAGWFSGI